MINIKAGEIWYTELTVENIKVAFKIETGKNINLLPIKYINKNIEQKIIKLYIFGIIRLEAIGNVNLNCKIINKNITFVVIKENLTPI